MLATTVLLTPMILAAEPVRLEIPDWSYDHGSQTSTIKGDSNKRFRLAYTSTQTGPNIGAPPGGMYDSDTDPDYPQQPAYRPAPTYVPPPRPTYCRQVCAQWNIFNPTLCFRYRTRCD